METSTESRAQPMKTTSKDQLSGRSRPRASQACLHCRQRKVKCIGLAPGRSCNSCSAAKKQCVMSRHGDGRRTGSREQVVALQDRLQRLESLLAERQDMSTSDCIIVSSAARDQAASSDDPLAMSSGSHLPEPSPTDIEAGLDTNVFQAYDNSQSNDYDIGLLSPAPQISEKPASDRLDDSIVGSEHPLQDTFTPGNPSQSQSHAPDSLSSSSASEKTGSMPPFPSADGVCDRPTPISEHGSRLGVDDACGQPCCYGPTSQLHVQKTCHSQASEQTGHSRSLQGDGDLSEDAAHLVESLLQNYFRSQPLAIAVINQASFSADRDLKVRSEYYSRFLENAILSCATRMSTSAEVRQLGGKYADRAKGEIGDELGRPNISSLQGFLLLSDFESTRGRDRLGYMYCGIACRLVFDLGLAENCSALIAGGKISLAAATERHSLLLAAYIYDKLWSMYLGRPSSIPASMVAIAHNRMKVQGWQGSDSLEQWTGLCTDISDATDAVIVSPSRHSSAYERLHSLDQRIRERQTSLTPTLALDSNRLADLHPNAYGLQIQFYGARIVFHRLMSRSSGPDDGLQGSMPTTADELRESQVSPESKRIMCESAITIARLVYIYKQIYGIENFITIMLDNMYVAAAVLISYVLHWSNDDLSLPELTDWQWLQKLADLLLMAQKHYPVTARMRATLAKIVSGSVLGGIFDAPQTSLPQSRQPRVASRAASPSSQSQAALVQHSDVPYPGDMNGRGFNDPQNPISFSFDGDNLFSDAFVDGTGMEMTNNVMDWVLPGLSVERDLDMDFAL